MCLSVRRPISDIWSQVGRHGLHMMSAYHVWSGHIGRVSARAGFNRVATHELIVNCWRLADIRVTNPVDLWWPLQFFTPLTKSGVSTNVRHVDWWHPCEDLESWWNSNTCQSRSKVSDRPTPSKSETHLAGKLFLVLRSASQCSRRIIADSFWDDQPKIPYHLRTSQQWFFENIVMTDLRTMKSSKKFTN